MKKVGQYLLVTLLMISLFFTNGTFALEKQDEKVNFNDKYLETYLIEQYAKNESYITKEEMKEITYLEGSTWIEDGDDYVERPFTDFTGLEYAINLEYITILVDPDTGQIPNNWQVIFNALKLKQISLDIIEPSYEEEIEEVPEEYYSLTKQAYNSILNSIPMASNIVAELGYNFLAVDFSWLDGYDLNRVETLYNTYDEYGTNIFLDYRYIGINEDGEKLYSATLINPVTAVKSINNTVVLDSQNEQVLMSSYNIENLDENTKIYDWEGNQISPEYYNEYLGFSRAELIFTETDLENTDEYSPMVNMQLKFGYDEDFVPVNEKLKLNRSLSIYMNKELFKVDFDSNGGSPVASITDVKSGSHITEPEAPIKANHEFLGWYTDQALTASWDFSSDTVTDNMTLYAKWEERYQVEFDSNGGSSVASITDVKSGSHITEPEEPIKVNHEFLGWYTDQSLTTAWDFSSDTVTDNMTLYAKWGEKISLYQVDFDSNGGSSVASITDVKTGSHITEPEAPIKANHEFLGWYTDQSLTTAWDFSSDSVTDNMTLYAKWEAKSISPTKPDIDHSEKQPQLPMTGMADMLDTYLAIIGIGLILLRSSKTKN